MARAASALLLLLPACLWFLPLLRGNVLFVSFTPLCDQWYVNTPFAVILGQALHAGRLPVWTDRIGGGFPLLAVGEAGVLYPPNLLLYRLFPPLLALHLNMILSVALASVWMYLLCRDYGRSRAGALLAGLAYSFSGFFVVHIATPHSIQAACWTPALALAARRAVRFRRPVAWALAGSVLALQITTGYPQVAYYSLLAAVFLGAWEWRVEKPAGAERPKGRNLLAGAALALAIGAGLSAAHWLPGRELQLLSTRQSGLKYDVATFFSYPPANLLTFVAPFAYGNPAAGQGEEWNDSGHFWDNGYLGLVPLALALFAVGALARRDRRALGLSVLLVVSLLIVLGRHTPFFAVLWHALPGMAYFRYPSRFMVIADLCLAALAAFGLDALCARVHARPAKNPSLSRALSGALLLLSAADLLSFAGHFQRFAPAGPWLAPPQTARLAARQPNALCYSFGYSTFEDSRARAGKGWMGNLAPLLARREALAPNLPVLYGLSTFNTLAGLETVSGAVLFRMLCEDKYLPGDDGSGRVVVPLRLARRLGDLGVTHVLSPYPLLLPGLRPVAVVPALDPQCPARLFAVEDPRPRLWIPRAAGRTANFPEARDAFLHTDDALVEGGPAGHGGCEGTVSSLELRPGWARATVRLSAPGYVIHNQRFYPGWQATVDGRPAELLRANLLMQAVAVPAGEHTVEFRFRSGSFAAGRAISLLTLGLLAAAGAWSLGRRRSPAGSARM